MEKVETAAKSGVKAVILREKDMSPEDYRELAQEVMGICEKHGTACILHSFTDIALSLGAENIHLPMHILRELPEEKKRSFRLIGASCHSVEEAIEAESLGAGYIIAGHIFATDCKKGLPPRGLDFLRAVCNSVKIPVYAIGGISDRNIASVTEAGAAGACMMSGFMM